MYTFRVDCTRAALLTAAAALACAGTSFAQVSIFSNGFENSNAGWDALALPNQPTRVASGTGGITSASGSFHATVGSGAATRWGAYRSAFPAGGYTTSVDIYLNLSGGAANDTRFDLTSAISTPAAAHRRDFAFNIGFYNDSDGTGSGPRFVMSASNGAGRSAAFPKNPGRSPYAVTSSGWYTLEHQFQNNGSGVLEAVLRLKSGTTVLSSWTLSDPTDVINGISGTVGGNRYTWVANNEFSSLAVDNSKMESPSALPVYNVTDGIYFESLTQAINATTTGTGDAIEVGEGTYNERILVNKSGLTIRAAAGALTKPKFEYTGSVASVSGTLEFAPGANDILVEGLEIVGIDGTAGLEKGAVYFDDAHSNITLRGNTITANGDGAILTEYGFVNSGITIENNLIDGRTFNLPVAGSGPGGQFVEPNWPRPAVYMSSGSSPFTHTNIVFRGNTVTVITGDATNGNLAVSLDGNGVTVEDNDFAANTGTKPGQSLLRVRGTNTVVQDNVFSGTADVALIVGSSSTDSAATTTVSQNVFSGTFASTKVANASASQLIATHNFWGDSSIPVSPSDFTGNAATVPYYTDAALTTLDGPVHNTTDNTFFATIGAALAAASTGAGDVIVVDAGVYSESSLTISKAVTINGPNAGIGGTGTRGAEASIFNTQITVTAAGAVIDGVEVSQTNNTSDAVQLQAAATLQNSVIKRNGVSTGTIARGVTTSMGISGVTITGNLFTGDLSGGLFGTHKTWNSGIYSNGGSGTITGNTFENCRTALNLDNFNAGISLTGNTFRSSGTYLSFGGTAPTDGQYVIAGNAFGYDYNLAPAANPSLLNNSNVAPTFRVNVTGNTFGGIATASLSNPQKFALEARMFHRGRSAKNGVIDFVTGEQIVVSGTTIASAISAASTGNIVRVGPGTFTEDVALSKGVTLQGTGAGSTTLVGPIGGASSATLQITASNATVDGFTITRAGNNVTDWNNPDLNSPGIAIQGTSITGTLISNNEITGNRSGIDINNSNGHTIRNNVIANNHTGLIFRNQTDSITFVENSVVANRTVGVLFLDASSGSNSPVQTATSCDFSNNEISGNWYGQVVDRQAGGSLPTPGTTNLKDFEGNWFGTSAPVVSTANSAEPGYAALIPVAFGGSATAPVAAQPHIAGPASANIDYKPYLSIGLDTNVETVSGRGTYGFQGKLSSLWDGTTISETISGVQSYSDLFVPAGKTITVTPTGSLIVTGKLELAPGATIVVNGGELVIGEDSKISGTFTVFNSFGSWDINGDTTFEIGRSLALVSDIHIAAGAVVTVNGGGELILDGCVIDSQTPSSPYSINVAGDGLLTIARSVVSDASIDINTVASSVPEFHRSKVYDNRFSNSEIEASASSAVYHNLFDTGTNGASNTDASTAFSDVDGWGNVTNASLLKNQFSLAFAAPLLADRTLDDGNLFVQTGDAVKFNLNVGSLAPNTITLAEALLGYNSERLTLVPGPTAVVPASGWDAVIDDDSVSAPLGLVDSALSLNLSASDDGIAGPATLGSVNFTAGTAGATVGFFRVQTDGNYSPDGSFMQDTRLTKSSGGIPSFLAPFTANTGELVVDNDDPAIAVPAVSGVQTQPTVGSVNVLQPTSNFVIRGQAPVILTFTATDTGLAGLDAADATNDLTLTANNGLGTILDSDDYTVTASESLGVVTYIVTLNIPVGAGNGTYAITATVQDRSGNDSTPANLGSFVIANEVLATVELQGFVGTGPNTLRNVTFVATGGVTTKTWVKAVSFTSSLGTVVLEDVPAGTVSISAKTAWNLRSKKAAVYSVPGVGSVLLTGTDKLNAGDYNNDNVVNTLDYSTLRYYWMSSVSFTPAAAVADSTGDGIVNGGDYNVLVPNFYTAGDAQ